MRSGSQLVSDSHLPVSLVLDDVASLHLDLRLDQLISLDFLTSIDLDLEFLEIFNNPLSFLHPFGRFELGIGSNGLHRASVLSLLIAHASQRDKLRDEVPFYFLDFEDALFI